VNRCQVLDAGGDKEDAALFSKKQFEDRWWAKRNPVEAAKLGVEERLLTRRRIGTDVGEVEGADLEVFGKLVVHNQRGAQRLTRRSDHGR